MSAIIDASNGQESLKRRLTTAKYNTHLSPDDVIEQQAYFERVKPIRDAARKVFEEQEEAKHKEFVRTEPCPKCNTAGKLEELPCVLYTEPAVYGVSCGACGKTSRFSEVGIPTFDGEKFLVREVRWLL